VSIKHRVKSLAGWWCDNRYKSCCGFALWSNRVWD